MERKNEWVRPRVRNQFFLWGGRESMRRVRVRDFNFCGTKFLRIGGRLKINPGRKGVALLQRFITAA